MSYQDKYHKYKFKYQQLKNTIQTQAGGNNKSTILLITRTLTKNIQERLESLLQVGIDAYIISDEFPTNTSERVIHYSDTEMQKLGWTHHMSQPQNKITAWDKATYYAYKLNRPYVWICEDDVYWNNTNKFRELLEISNSSDLIAYPLVESYEIEPKWHHWDKVKILTSDYTKWTATFNQLCRLSNRLLKKVKEISEERERLYFHEVMFATLCNLNHFKIGYFNKLELNLFILFRYENPFNKKQIDDLEVKHKDILVHPVKYINLN